MAHTAADLMKGSWHALQQCGFLLRDAVRLYDLGGHSSGVALAMLAREELGKHGLLLDLFKAARGGAAFDAASISKATEDHVKKQAEGQLSVVLRAESASKLGQAMKDEVVAGPNSSAAILVEAAKKSKEKRDPEARRELRERALYVDPVDAGGWRRPCEVSRTDAENAINDAVNDYAGQRDRLLRLIVGDPEPFLVREFPELAEGLRGWNERPELLAPTWTALPEVM